MLCPVLSLSTIGKSIYYCPVNVNNVVISNEYAEDKPPLGISKGVTLAKAKRGDSAKRRRPVGAFTG